MKHTWLTGFVCAATLLCCSACRPTKEMNKKIINHSQPLRGTGGLYGGGNMSVSSPRVFVYKTKADYSNLVPVQMDESRTRIVSYPHPNDLTRGDKLCLPTLLEEGYWLDNRGIGERVAFLSYTYEEYSQLPAVPSMEELLSHIVAKYPLTEWHECGRWTDYQDIISELNILIKQRSFQK